MGQNPRDTFSLRQQRCANDHSRALNGDLKIEPNQAVRDQRSQGRNLVMAGILHQKAKFRMHSAPAGNNVYGGNFLVVTEYWEFVITVTYFLAANAYGISNWRNSPGFMASIADCNREAAARIRRKLFVESSMIGIRRPLR
jgi:hypothetical protein